MATDNSIAIIGDGVGGLITFTILQHNRFPANSITIYGESPQPLATLATCVRAIGQERMRSESSGHLNPLDFPGLSFAESWQKKSPLPLLASLFDTYNPSFDLLIAQSEKLAKQTGFFERKVSKKIHRIARRDDSHFVLYDESGEEIGIARHVLLALGHAGFAWGPISQVWRDHPRVRHAYHAHSFKEGERVTIIGNGMTAAHLWIKALGAGAGVTVLHRHPLRHQRLNAARCVFSGVGIETYQQSNDEERANFLRGLGEGTFPWNGEWEKTLGEARRQHRLVSIQDDLQGIEESPQGSLKLTLAGGATLETDSLICATGFQIAPQAYPLIDKLLQENEAGIESGNLFVTDDFNLTPLSREKSVCGVVGALARWALPIADTFVGIKYAARRLVPQLRT